MRDDGRAIEDLIDRIGKVHEVDEENKYIADRDRRRAREEEEYQTQLSLRHASGRYYPPQMAE